jgi:predicted AlkP superfamily phosphohydrolase/phosphomutase
VIDVPKTAPSQMHNGLHIVDWGSHDPDQAGFVVSPAAAAPEIVEKFGVETMHDCNALRTTGEQYRDFRDHLIDRAKRKTALSAHYLDKGNWDCFLTVFSESHCVGHQCWHLHDEQHQKYDPEFAAVAGDPICAVYQAIDRGIGELIRQAGDNTHIVVFASHGMGPHYDASFLLDDMLCRLENRQPGPVRSTLATVVPRLWQRLPRAVRNLAARPLRNRVRTSLGVDPAAGRAGRRCFKVPNNDAWGGIRVNLIGREPEGRVAAGRDYDDYCAELSRDLLAFVNVTTGEPLVKRVERSVDLFEGEYLHHLPDLLVEWNRSAPVAEIYSPKTGRISGEYRKCRTGDHTADGLFFVSGPGVTPGQVGEPVSVTDLAPTIAALSGVELTGVDGRSIGPLIGIDRNPAPVSQ